VNSSLAALVLAAGASRRLGQPKQLLLLGGETLLERALRLSIEAGATPVFAVLGAHQQRILQSVPMHNAIPVINDGWEQGISTSIHAGLDALEKSSPNAAAALILTCDQPRLTVDHLRALMDAFAAQAEPVIVASAYAGVLGIPAVFPRIVFAHLRALGGDRGARALLVKPPCRLIQVPFPGGEIDIDDPADLNLLQ
jgi:CTP:molybdopterin cytidylyltransferase MocA